MEDEAFPELSLPQAVSEKVAATPMAARVAMRVYFTVFPQVARCIRSEVFVSRTELQAVLRDVFVLSQEY
ncbi:hypothetical protein GCM10010270_83560 [Streptomyces violaceus]|nr:hypothetical protein GCM10010270_83560 [Streptomyces janthinus]